jgi:hypothetical protein
MELIDTASAIIGTGKGPATMILNGSSQSFVLWELEGNNGVDDRLVVGGQGEGTLQIEGLAQVILVPDTPGIRIGTATQGRVEVNGRGMQSGGLGIGGAQGAKLDAYQSAIDIGSTTAPGSLAISGGGKVIAGNVNLNGPEGTFLTVSDMGSRLDASGQLVVHGGSQVTVSSQAVVTSAQKLDIQNSHVVVTDGALDVGYTQLQQFTPGEARFFSEKNAGGSVTMLVVNTGTFSASKNLILGSDILINPIPPDLSGRLALIVVQLLSGSITVGQFIGPAAANTVIVGAGGQLAGVGVIIGPDGVHAPIFCQNGGICTLIPYSWIKKQTSQSPVSTVRNAPVSSKSARTLTGNLKSVSKSSVRKLSQGTPSVVDLPATLIIDGSYAQTADGNLNVVIAGPTPLVDYGVLGVTGTIKLAGKATLSFTNGFAPRRGQSFSFINSAAAPTGQFDRIEVTGLSPGFNYQIVPSTNGMSLVALNDAIAISPPVLSIASIGPHQLQISWPYSVAGFTLQSTTNLAQGNWIDIDSPSNPLIISPDLPAQFFRFWQATGSTSSLPQISLTTGGFQLGGFQLAWPTNFADYSLQWTTNLGNGPWMNLPTTNNPIVILPTGPFQFFRLINPPAIGP